MQKSRPVPSDPAVVELVQAAEAGAADAAKELADCYRSGKGVKRSNELALHWYTVGAKVGDANAQNNLGTMLLNGIGCEADEAAAVPWYRASAEQGNAVAQFNLGLRYLHGSGAEQDDRTAGAWIAKSAAQDYIPAIGQLGTLFRFGRGTKPDLLQAAQLHLAAAQAGDATSHGNLSDYRAELIGIAAKGNREAAFDLCRMYDRGLGSEKDPALCWAWVQWAYASCATMPKHKTRVEDLDAEVAAAFTFFQTAIDRETRERGDSLLVELIGKSGGSSKQLGAASRRRTQQGKEKTG